MEDIAALMRERVSRMQNNNVFIKPKSASQQPASATPKETDWYKTLPEIPANGFLLDIMHENIPILFFVKEIDWMTAMNIDRKAYRINESSESYYSEEYERRQVLSRAIIWIAKHGEPAVFNHENDILGKLNYEIIDILWSKYQAIVGISVQEAQQLYETTKKYLNSEAQEGIPLPAIIPYTIAICDGWCSMSSEELKSLSAGDWERMQIIKMARADLMNIYTPSQVRSQGVSANVEVTENTEKDGAEWFKNLPIGHPNRPPGI